MSIIIKVPDEKVNKFRLQKKDTKGRRFLRAASLLNALSYYKFKERTSIVVKEYIHSHFETLNESLASTDKNYLLHCAACFLEDYLSPLVIKKYEKSLHI